MPCEDCQPRPRRRPEPSPCPGCVAEHLRLAALQASQRQRDRYRAYWHLARAAELAGEPLRSAIITARRAWQRDGVEPRWDRLVDARHH